MNRVVVTGIGAVTPVGNDVEATWSSLLAGRSGIGRISTFEPETFKVQIAGLVKDFDLADYPRVAEHELAQHLSRSGRLRRRSREPGARGRGDRRQRATHRRTAGSRSGRAWAGPS